MKKTSFLLILLIFIMSTFPVFGADNQVILTTLTKDGTGPSIAAPPVASLIIKSPLGITAFFDLNSFERKWPELEDANSLFATSVIEPEHSFHSTVYKLPGAKLIAKTGTITSGDIKITSIEGSRFDDNVDGSNHILIIEVNEMRIVHFGDCGQSKLTDKQIKAIGRVDVALYPIEWIDSNVNMGNKRSLKVLEQVQPTIVIPTHINTLTAVKALNKNWPSQKITNSRIILTQSFLSKGKRAIFWGYNLPLAQEANLPEFNN